MKKPHELVTSEFIPFREYSILKSDLSSIPVGSYAWNRQGLARDSAVLELVELDPKALLYHAVDAMENEWALECRYRNIGRVNHQLQKTGQLPPINAYLDKNKNIRCVYLSSYIAKVAQSHQLPKVKVWLMDATKGYALNRTLYLQQAAKDGLSIPAEVLEEYDSGAFGLSLPLHCPTLTETDSAFVGKPNVGDHLERLYEALLKEDKANNLTEIQKRLRALDE